MALRKKQQEEEREPSCSVSLWETDSDNASAPILSGYLQFDIEELKELVIIAMEKEANDYDQYSLRIAIWENTKGGESSPSYTGKVTNVKEKTKKRRR